MHCLQKQITNNRIICTQSGFQTMVLKEDVTARSSYLTFSVSKCNLLSFQNIWDYIDQSWFQVAFEMWWSQLAGGWLSPPQRLPLGIPIKISIIEKIESARRTRALSFSFSPASPQHKEASVEERGWLVCGLATVAFSLIQSNLHY